MGDMKYDGGGAHEIERALQNAYEQMGTTAKTLRSQLEAHRGGFVGKAGDALQNAADQYLRVSQNVNQKLDTLRTALGATGSDLTSADDEMDRAVRNIDFDSRLG